MLVINKKGSLTHSKALLLLVATALLWSIGGLFIKSVAWNPFAIAGMRSAIASLVIFSYLKKPKINFSKPQIIGAIAYALTVILFVTANKNTTAANAIILQYTAPVYVSILGAIFLKERTRFADIVTIIFVLGGMLLFFIDSLSFGGTIGNILALISGLTFAILTVSMRMQKDGSPMETTLIGNVLTALFGLPFMFQSMPSLQSWGALIILGVFQLGLSYVFYSIAMKKATAMEGILIPVIEPLLNPVWVLIFLGEKPSFLALTGGIIVIASVTLRCIVSVNKFKKVDV